MRKTVEFCRKPGISGPSRVTFDNGEIVVEKALWWNDGNVTAYVETSVGGASAAITMSPEEVRELIDTLSEFLEN